MKVVLDTNVFVAAGFNSHSHAARILEAVRAGRLALVWNEETRSETQYIIKKIPPLAWSDFAPLFRQESRFDGTTEPDQFIEVSDPDDRKFAALALAADATLITQDDHLLAVREVLGAEVKTPREFWEGLAGTELGA
jgi:predicted nucleic acid-binding protein